MRPQALRARGVRAAAARGRVLRLHAAPAAACAAPRAPGAAAAPRAPGAAAAQLSAPRPPWGQYYCARPPRLYPRLLVG